MTALPDSILEMPPQAVDIVIPWGMTFQWRRALGLGTTTNGVTTIASYIDLTGVTPTAFLVDMRGYPLVPAQGAQVFTCSVVAPATGGLVKVYAGPLITGKLPLPADANPNGGKAIIGRWMLNLTDSAGNVVNWCTGRASVSWNNRGTAGQ